MSIIRHCKWQEPMDSALMATFENIVLYYDNYIVFCSDCYEDEERMSLNSNHFWYRFSLKWGEDIISDIFSPRGRQNQALKSYPRLKFFLSIVQNKRVYTFGSSQACVNPSCCKFSRTWANSSHPSPLLHFGSSRTRCAEYSSINKRTLPQL